MAAPTGGSGGTPTLPVTTNKWHLYVAGPDPENAPIAEGAEADIGCSAAQHQRCTGDAGTHAVDRHL